MSGEMDRRSFVKKTVIASAGAGVLARGDRSMAGEHETTPVSTTGPVAGAMPIGQIGDMKISRLLLGGNLLTHYTHSRDLKYVYALATHYNTREKILETLAIAEQNGVNTLVVHNVRSTIEILQEHRRRGGKIQWITCTFHALVGGVARFSREIEQLVDSGTDALYVSGVEGDHVCGFRNPMSGEQAATRTNPADLDLLGKAVDLAKAHGLPTGLGAHRLGTIQDCEKAGIDVDFYLKTFHHHDYPSAKMDLDSSFCPDSQRVAAFMQTVEKPWIAYKVMAAGAIPPENGFKYAFDNGADFVLAGMFDFEVEEDARLIREIFPKAKRSRPLRA